MNTNEHNIKKFIEILKIGQESDLKPFFISDKHYVDFKIKFSQLSFFTQTNDWKIISSNKDVNYTAYEISLKVSKDWNSLNNNAYLKIIFSNETNKVIEISREDIPVFKIIPLNIKNEIESFTDDFLLALKKKDYETLYNYFMPVFFTDKNEFIAKLSQSKIDNINNYNIKIQDIYYKGLGHYYIKIKFDGEYIFEQEIDLIKDNIIQKYKICSINTISSNAIKLDIFSEYFTDIESKSKSALGYILNKNISAIYDLLVKPPPNAQTREEYINSTEWKSFFNSNVYPKEYIYYFTPYHFSKDKIHQFVSYKSIKNEIYLLELFYEYGIDNKYGLDKFTVKKSNLDFNITQIELVINNFIEKLIYSFLNKDINTIYQKIDKQIFIVYKTNEDFNQSYMAKLYSTFYSQIIDWKIKNIYYLNPSQFVINLRITHETPYFPKQINSISTIYCNIENNVISIKSLKLAINSDEN